MRSLFIALTVIIIVVAAMLGWALYNIDTVVNWNKDRIMAAASRRIGRSVQFDRVHVHLRGGTRVRILGLAVSEGPSAGSERLLEAPEVRVGLQLRFLRPRITVTRVEAAGAVLHYRDGRRHLRLQDLEWHADAHGDGARLRSLRFRLGQAEFSGNGVIESFTPLIVTCDLRAPQLRMADIQVRPADGVLEEVHASGRLVWKQDPAGGGTLTASRGKLMGVDFSDLAATVGVARPWFALESLRLKALDGTLEANGRMQVRDAPFPFEAELRVRGLDAGAYLNGAGALPPTEGTLKVDVRVAGQGRTWNAIKPTLTGTGKAAVLEGRVREFNLAEEVLEGVTGIQGLTGLFSRRLRDRYPHIFQRGTTVLERLDGEFEAKGGKVLIKGVTLKAKDYGLTGSGSVALDGATDVHGVLTLSPRLSTDLVPPSRLDSMANDRGEVELPFAVNGTAPNVRVKPKRQLVTRLLEGRVGARLGKLLDLFSGPETPQEAEEPRATQESPEASEKKPESARETQEAGKRLQQLIDRGLRIFRNND